MRRILKGIGLLLACLVVVVAVKTATFRSRQERVLPAEALSFDSARAREHLAGAIRFRTVSFQDPAQQDAAQFAGLQAYLQASFPRLRAALVREVVGERSLLYTWKGSDASLRPAVLMAHQDVVPVPAETEKSWRYPPFSGQIAEGFVWGRGALDDKGSLIAILEAMEALLAQGFQPRRTLYLASGEDEELGGTRSSEIAALLQQRGVRAEFVLDEGSMVLEGVVPGLSRPTALVGTAEKSVLTLELSARGEGGHASMPPPHTAIGILSAAVARLEAHPFPARLAGPTGDMFAFLGPEMRLPLRAFFANRWLFGGLITRKLAARPTSNAMVRTTLAPTIFQAGEKENVLPQEARAVLNLRLLPGDDPAVVIARVERAVDDPRVRIRILLQSQSGVGRVTSVRSAGWRLIERTARQIFPDAVVSPSLFIAATDSRHYTGMSDAVLRFLPVRLDAGSHDLERVHGTNERIGVREFEEMVRFYGQIIRNAN